jgi:hypothetical protein
MYVYQVNLLPVPAIMNELLSIRKLRKRFITWILTECVSIHPKRNKIFAFLRSLELKMGGATRATMETQAERNGYCFLLLSLSFG